MPLEILFGVLFTAAVSIALGILLLGECCTDWGLRFVSGAALLSTAVFAMCALGVVYPWVFLAFGGLALGAAWRFGGIAGEKRGPGVGRVLGVVFAVYFVLYFFSSMAPEFSFDGSRYHLGLVGRYLREHGFHRITDNIYASLSQGVEMLFLFAYAFGRHSAAAMVHFAFLTSLAWMMFRYAGSAGFRTAGAVGAALVWVSPMMGVDGTSAYNDVAVAAIAFALFWLLQVWEERRGVRLLAAIGLVAGFAYAAKYTAWMAVPYALGFVGWKSRRVRDVATVAVCAALMILPWAGKNWIWVRNPVAPFFNNLFPNPYVTVAFEQDYRRHLAIYDLKSRWEIPLDLTVHGSLGGLLGPVFLLAPVGLLALGRRQGRQLLLAAAVFGVGYFSNISTRFLLPSLPFVALAMGLALSSFPRAAVALVVMHAVLSWPDVLRRYSAPSAWRLAKVPVREALRIKPEQGFLESNLPDYGVDRMVEQATAPGSTVFCFTPIPEAYTSRRILVAYQSAANIDRRRTLFTGFVPEYAPTWRLVFSFPRQRLRAVRMVQTNAGTDLWNLHEVRVFDGTTECPRDGWLATARPDPWGAGNLLDSDLLTFWVSGHTLQPGQDVEVDFDRAAMADSVRMDAAPNQWGLGLRLEGQDEAGNWRQLAGGFQAEDAGPAPDLRRRAAVQLKRTGVDYLLIFDREFGAADLRDHTDLWGIRPVAEYRGVRLYQLP